MPARGGRTLAPLHRTALPSAEDISPWDAAPVWSRRATLVQPRSIARFSRWTSRAQQPQSVSAKSRCRGDSSAPARRASGQRPPRRSRALRNDDLRGRARCSDRARRMSFGSERPPRLSLRGTFNEAHVPRDHPGDLRLPEGAAAPPGLSSSAKDTHALSEPAFMTALEVLTGNSVEDHDRRRRRLDADPGNLTRDPDAQPSPLDARCADGIVVTPSHNPPEDGRPQVQPATSGPATRMRRAGSRNGRNRLLRRDRDSVRAPCVEERARASATARYDSSVRT